MGFPCSYLDKMTTTSSRLLTKGDYKVELLITPALSLVLQKKSSKVINTSVGECSP